MIPIVRSAPPRVLAENGEAWTAELLAALAAEDPVPKQLLYRYGHPDVFAQLAEDAHWKCMYCESKIAHVSFPQVEHIAPKISYPERTFEWCSLPKFTYASLIQFIQFVERISFSEDCCHS